MSLADRRSEYETAGLDIGDVAADPIEQWWRWYRQAEEAGATEPNAMTVATVDADGLPDARIVLARGADDGGIDFFTNYSSPKSRQIETNPDGAAVFGWLQLHRQVRVRGSIERLSPLESDAYFATRPRGSQIGAWASPQSSVLVDRSELEALVADVEVRFRDRPVPRPDGWGGWRLRHETVEFWQGRPSRLHDRLRYRRGDVDWIIERLAP